MTRLDQVNRSKQNEAFQTMATTKGNSKMPRNTKKTTNTTTQGNAFRDSVLQLIKLRPGCQNVVAEMPIGSQPVDLYYEERTSCGIDRIACECKDYDRPLTKTVLAEKIVTRYQPLLDNRLIDRVRIIAPLELGSIAQNYINELRHFSFTTKNTLEAQIIDFGNYVRSVEKLYTEKGLNQYYISPTLPNGEELESIILNWIDGDSSQPIAILAGYGMGKTSFAVRIANTISEKFTLSGTGRIPILIPLSEIASEQRLEGLLGRLLTSETLVANYSYGLFAELNSRGRFLIILDGFDEMKHTMSWGEFKHNFSQLNRLVVPNSRVLLLGRPSAFQSEHEHLWILSGTYQKGSTTFHVPDAPNYKELELQQFTSEQAIQFIEKYANYQSRLIATIRGETHHQENIDRRIETVESDPELMTLALRPVQAKMIADLAIDPGVSWKSFTRYELYSEFIQRIIERESEKPTRATYSSIERYRFHKELAWWMWNKSSPIGFKLSELPPSLLDEFLPTDNSKDDDAALRDLISGSLLDRKLGDAYFFPHRSFIEFLVAQHICDTSWSSSEIDRVANSLTDEVIDFIKESDGRERISAMATLVNDAKRPLTCRFFSLLAWAINCDIPPSHDGAEPEYTPYDLALEYWRLVDASWRQPDIINYLFRALRSVSSAHTKLICIHLMILASFEAPSQTKTAIWEHICAFIVSCCLDEFKRILGQSIHARAALDNNNPFIRLFVSGVTYSKRSPDGEFLISLSPGEIIREIKHCVPINFQLSDVHAIEASEPLQVEFTKLIQWNPHLKITKEGSFVTRIFNKYKSPKDLIPVTHKVDRTIHGRTRL